MKKSANVVSEKDPVRFKDDEQSLYVYLTHRYEDNPERLRRVTAGLITSRLDREMLREMILQPEMREFDFYLRAKEFESRLGELRTVNRPELLVAGEEGKIEAAVTQMRRASAARTSPFSGHTSLVFQVRKLDSTSPYGFPVYTMTGAKKRRIGPAKTSNAVYLVFAVADYPGASHAARTSAEKGH